MACYHHTKVVAWQHNAAAAAAAAAASLWPLSSVFCLPVLSRGRGRGQHYNISTASRKIPRPDDGGGGGATGHLPHRASTYAKAAARVRAPQQQHTAAVAPQSSSHATAFTSQTRTVFKIVFSFGAKSVPPKFTKQQTTELTLLTATSLPPLLRHTSHCIDHTFFRWRACLCLSVWNRSLSTDHYIHHHLHTHHRHFSTGEGSSHHCKMFDNEKPKDDSENDSQLNVNKKGALAPIQVLGGSPPPDTGHVRLNKMPIQKPSNKIFRIVVEGNIGSGKTTFLKIFSKNCNSTHNKPLVVPEPIDLWRNVGGVNIFQLLADDPKRWSFVFQSYVQLTMLQIHQMTPTESNLIAMERSLFSARYCFVENLYHKNLLQSCERYVLDQWFQASLPSIEVDLIIYLRCDPEVAYERIKRRGRPEEAGLTLNYLRTLHELHDDWLIRGKFPLPSQVVTIDANISMEEIVSVYEEKTGGILREHTVMA